MNEEQFWTLVETSGRQTQNKQDRERWLRTRLTLLRGHAIIDFEILLDATRRRVDTYTHWGALHRIIGFASTDSFFYFQPWLIGLGRDAFERIAASPDQLADIPEIRKLADLPRPWPNAVWPAWESLNYVALYAYQHIAGEQVDVRDVIHSHGQHLLCDPEPSGIAWNFEDDTEVRRCLPRLHQLFPREPR